MTTFRPLPLILATLGAAAPAAAQDKLRVEPDPEHVVASRLLGSWRIDPELHRRLGGGTPSQVLQFASKPEVLDGVPDRMRKAMAEKRIYLAGTVLLQGKEHPFLLIEHRGNAHLVWFRERGGDPMGDTESCNLMLARAADQDDDVLLVGGDFNNQPFAAYSRGEAPREPAVLLREAQAEMLRLLVAKEHRKLLERYTHPDDVKKITDEEGGIDQALAEFVGRKATRLRLALEQAMAMEPEFADQQTTASFPVPGLDRPLRFRRVEERWYLRN